MSRLVHSHAAVVGINAYSGTVAPLVTAVDDARAVATALESDHAYDSCHLLLDGEATRERLVDLLEHKLPRTVGADDRLVLYFAGHGVALGDSQEGPQGYLLPQDAGPDSSSWLSMTWLRATLNELPCRHLLVVLDCCFAGTFRWTSPTRSFLPTGQLYDSQYDRFVAGTAWQVLTSSAHNERALDTAVGVVGTGPASSGSTTAGRHSPFTAALLRGLAGEADSARGRFEPDGVITATELHQYVTEVLLDASTSAGVSPASVQTPGLWPLKPESTGEFIFRVPGRRRSTRPDPPLDDEANPWRGLSAYTEAQADGFFGRGRVVQALVERLLEGDAPPFLAVVGPSGAGKSSLVHAGLLTALRHAGSKPPASPWTVAVIDRLDGAPDIALAEALDELSAAPAPERRLLVIDQLEELFTQCHDSGRRRRFLDTLAGTADRDEAALRVVATLRSDFEPLAAAAPGLGTLLAAGRFVVPPFTREELRETIVRPAQLHALYFEPPELVEQLLDEVAAVPGSLPLLSFALSETYRQAVRRRQATGELDRALTAGDFRAAGGVIGAIHRRATELVDQADPATRDTVRRVFLRMISTEGGQLARRRVSYRELEARDAAETARVREMLERFTAARLLVADEDSVEPAHDTLVMAWPTLNTWRNEAAEALPVLRAAWHAALDWESSGGEPGWLWDRDPRLPQLESLDGELNRLEARFAHESRRRQRRKARTTTGLALVVGGALAGLALHARRQERLARSHLEHAREVADEILFTVERDLRPIAGTTAVRRRLLESTSWLLDRLREGGPGDAHTLHSRLMGHVRRGDLARSHDDLARMESEYRAAVEIAERLVRAAPRRARWRFALSHSLSKWAGAAWSQGERERADERFERSREILERLVHDDPGHVSWRRSLAIRYNQLGTLASSRGRLDEARSWFEKSLHLKRRLAEAEPDRPSTLHELFESYDKLGQLAAKQGERLRARQWFEKSLRTKRRLAEAEPQNSRWRHALASSYESLGELAQADGDLDAAEKLFDDAHGLRQELASLDPTNLPWQRDLADNLGRLGSVAEARDEIDGARDLYARSRRIYQALTEADPGNPKWRRNLEESRSRLCAVESSRSVPLGGIGRRECR